jgi:hypothetical protein
MLRKTLLAAVLLMHSVVGYAEPSTSPTPSFFFEPIKTQVVKCSQLGSEWQSRLAMALRSAQSNTANLLPAESWANLLSSSTKLDGSVPLKAQVDTCESFVTYLSDPLLSNRIRGGMVSGLHLQAVAGCAAAFPSLAKGLRAVWISAFKRNELNPDEQLYDEYVSTSWRKPSGDKGHRDVCDQTIDFLKGTDFDKFASEQGIKRYLANF